MKEALHFFRVDVMAFVIMGLVVLGLDMALNRPLGPREIAPGPVVILDDIHACENNWTISTGSSEYGLVGWGPSPYRGSYTSIQIGRGSIDVPLCIFTVSACLLAGVTFCFWLGLTALTSIFANNEKPTS